MKKLVLLLAVTLPLSAFEGRPISDLRLPIARQENVRIAAGPGLYLVAWQEGPWGESVVRATRVDRNGNYLDREGILLAPAGQLEAIAGDGSSWFVLWIEENAVRGRTVSADGRLGPTIPIGEGWEAAVLWTGTAYVVAYANAYASGGKRYATLYTTTVLPGGTVTPPRVLKTASSDNWLATLVLGIPALAILNGQPVVFFAEQTFPCPRPGPPWECVRNRIQALVLDANGAAAGEPLLIADPPWYLMTGLSATSDGTRALVMWSRRTIEKPSLETGLASGAFVTNAGALSAGAPFEIGRGHTPSAAFDGSQFHAAWSVVAGATPLRELRGGVIEPPGNVRDVMVMKGNSLDAVSDPSLAVNANLPLLMAFSAGKYPAYEYRGALLFMSELAGTTYAPAPPLPRCAWRDGGIVHVEWAKPVNSFGTRVEQRSDDGKFTPVAIANAAAASTQFASTSNAPFRLLSWNAAGLSAPSALFEAFPPPSASMRDAVRTCAGEPVTLTATLHGTPPFTVRWADGLVQSQVTTMTVPRTATFEESATLSITSVDDASCVRGTARETVHVTVDAKPKILEQATSVQIKAGERTRLAVFASSDDVQYEWFEGVPGDVSRPLEAFAPSFTTPPLFRTTHYWVRVHGRCGSVDSEPVVVVVLTKQRAARH